MHADKQLWCGDTAVARASRPLWRVPRLRDAMAQPPLGALLTKEGNYAESPPCQGGDSGVVESGHPFTSLRASSAPRGLPLRCRFSLMPLEAVEFFSRGGGMLSAQRAGCPRGLPLRCRFSLKPLEGVEVFSCGSGTLPAQRARRPRHLARTHTRFQSFRPAVFGSGATYSQSVPPRGVSVTGCSVRRSKPGRYT
jgi:hypothetical protein